MDQLRKTIGFNVSKKYYFNLIILIFFLVACQEEKSNSSQMHKSTDAPNTQTESEANVAPTNLPTESEAIDSFELPEVLLEEIEVRKDFTFNMQQSFPLDISVHPPQGLPRANVGVDVYLSRNQLHIDSETSIERYTSLVASGYTNANGNFQEPLTIPKRVDRIYVVVHALGLHNAAEILVEKGHSISYSFE